MPPTTSYSYGDVVLVPFSFTDQTGLKKRPAIVVSSQAYDQRRRDLVIMAVSSQAKPTPDFGELTVKEWKKAGLIKPSVTKPVLATIEKRLVLRKLGRLQDADRAALHTALRIILG
jgi:mRNA interferase MazF